MDETRDGVWKDGKLVATYLTGVRAAIPLAAEQLETMCRVIAELTGNVRCFADLGCGDGTLAAALLDRFPAAAGLLVDHSPPMLDRARQRFADSNADLRFREADLAGSGWCDAQDGPFDAVVSGFSIHHLPHPRKRALYQEIFACLAPGGLFVNVEHVASSTPELERIFNESMVDSMLAHQQRIGADKTRDQVAREYVYRPDKAANILAPVEEQCQWLRRIGFEQVDCFLKYYELAVFGGRKPDPISSE